VSNYPFLFQICETTFPMDKSHSAEHWSEHCAGSCQHAKKLRILLGKFDAAKRGQYCYDIQYQIHIFCVLPFMIWQLSQIVA